MSTRDRLLPALALGACLLGTGCLENLNQSKYFDRLHEDAPEQWERILRDRDSVEKQLRAALTSPLRTPAEYVPLWGESWDVVRRVSDGEQVFMRGRIFHETGPATPYYIAFHVDEFGKVRVDAIKVMEGPG